MGSQKSQDTTQRLNNNSNGNIIIIIIILQLKTIWPRKLKQVSQISTIALLHSLTEAPARSTAPRGAAHNLTGPPALITADLTRSHHLIQIKPINFSLLGIKTKWSSVPTVSVSCENSRVTSPESRPRLAKAMDRDVRKSRKEAWQGKSSTEESWTSVSDAVETGFLGAWEGWWFPTGCEVRPDFQQRAPRSLREGHCFLFELNWKSFFSPQPAIPGPTHQRGWRPAGGLPA